MWYRARQPAVRGDKRRGSVPLPGWLLHGAGPACWVLAAARARAGYEQNGWVRCPIIIGREEPVSLIAGALRRLRVDARGGGLVVVGEAGVGKTRLAEHVGEAAAGAGITAVTGRALPPMGASPLRPFAEVLLGLARDRPAPSDDDLASYAAVLSSLVPHWRVPGWPVPDEPVVVMAEAVLRVLRWATGGAGAVVILEDLHWADEPTLAVARYLIDHADEVPVLLFGTVRTGEDREDVPVLLAGGGAQVCLVGRLTDEQAGAMARACAGPGSSPAESIAAVVRDAGGLPLLVEDLLATGDLGGFPPRFAGTVRARLARLDAPHRTVLDAAAVLGRRFDWRLLERAAGVAGSDVAGALHRCAVLQLIMRDGAGFAFRHALTRDVVLAELAVPERCRLSVTAAEALMAAGNHGDEQLLMIGRLLAEGGEPRRAAEALLAAARQAVAAGSLSSAELLLGEAGRATGSSEDAAAEISCERAQVLLQAGRPAEAASVASRMVATADGRDVAAATAMRVVLARAAVMTGAWPAARLELADIRRAVPVSPATQAELDVIEAQVALGDAQPGSRGQAERLAAHSGDSARNAGRPDLACEALEVLGLAARLRDLDAAQGALARALDVAAAAGLRVHRLRILNELGTVEMLRDARGDRLEQARREASRAGAVGLAAGIGANIAALMAMTARFGDALAMAGEVEHTAGRLGLIPLQAAALLMQGFAMAHQGRASDMERYLTAAEAAAPDDADLRAGAWGIGRGIGALVAEDRNAARQAFTRARAQAPDQHARILNPYEGPELLLRALAGEAGPSNIDTASAGVVKAARWPQLWFGAARAVATGAAGDPAGAAAALDAALRAGDRYPVFSALTMRLTAEAATRDGWGEPAALLRDAETTFTRLRLGRAATACRTLLKAAGHTAPRRRAADAELPAFLITAGVTSREAEVLDLLADRLSNREIAGRLFVSPRTVEKHVAALLAKLGAGDRGTLTQLARSLR
jgi:DNA-binding CsgD family transcriptional regulator